jgi:phenylacetate-CoA ligase
MEISKTLPLIPKGFNEVVTLERKLKKKKEDYWLKNGQLRALQLFKMMSLRVPAYKDFLKKNRIDPEKIRTIKDFKFVPTIDKYNYLRSYPLEKLCWDGNFRNKSWIISITSGSTGDPLYFPRETEQDKQYAILAELYLRTNFQIQRKSTLYIIGFPMGAWIGGVFTLEALRIVAKKKGYKLSVITPGINKPEIIKAVKKLGNKFDQIIIGSYGPFLKDTLDDGIREGVNWKSYNLGFIFSAEGFTEEFRDYVMKIAGVKNTYTATLNHYGTVDLGTMSYETPISILIRRHALKNRDIYKKIFGDVTKLPTFTQFLPEFHYFESVNGNLVCSAFSGLPLVRYDLKDHGGVIPFNRVLEIFSESGTDLLKESVKADIKDTVWNLPFVYVYERSDFSVSFYAFQIYSETIRRALQKISLEDKVTGKFTMIVKFSREQNQYLEINIEMKSGLKKSRNLEMELTKQITKQLLEESSEYRETYREISKRAEPKIILWPYEDLVYFKPGIKQKWVIK